MILADIDYQEQYSPSKWSTRMSADEIVPAHVEQVNKQIMKGFNMKVYGLSFTDKYENGLFRQKFEKSVDNIELTPIPPTKGQNLGLF